MKVRFSVSEFRSQFPAFADPAVLTDDALKRDFVTACHFAWPHSFRSYSAAATEQALYLMTAHIATLSLRAAADGAEGGSSGQVTSSSVGGVSVSIQAPPSSDGWQFWLSSTPYGLQLWAMLSVQASGGTYVGGSYERSGFRKGGGGFMR